MKQTSLYLEHKKLNAKLVPFAGYEMPIQYQSILAEHKAVRNNAGVFDVSHMGQFLIGGVRAIKDLQYLLSNDITNLALGDAQYTLLCQEDGGIIDDLIIYRIENDLYLLVVNAANIDVDKEQILKHLSSDTIFIDKSSEYSMLALAGPLAFDVFQLAVGKVLTADKQSLNVHQLKTFQIAKAVFEDQTMFVATTGYTGEKGVEIIIPNDIAVSLWNEILLQGALPCGLASRDLLRLEKCYPLHGNDISKDTNPISAGLGFAVSKEKNFIASDSLIKMKEAGLDQKLVAIKCVERGIPRTGLDVYVEQTKVGTVTSGTMSPLLQTGIALAYIDSEFCTIGQPVLIDIRGRMTKAEIVKKPFV